MAPSPIVTPGITIDAVPNQTSLPDDGVAAARAARDQVEGASAHSPPKIGNGKVDGPAHGVVGAGHDEAHCRSPSAQYLPMTSRSGP